MKLLPYEVWRDIPGYGGRYQASSMGNIRSVDWEIAWRGTTKVIKGRILSPALSNKGYLYVGLTGKDGTMRCKKIHRLVALTFLGNPYNLSEINHKSECKTDNQISNLEWCSASYNHNYGTRNERARNSVKRPVLQYTVDGVFIKEWDSAKDAAQALGAAGNASIINCCSGRNKTAYGYVWKRKNERL